MEVVSEVSKFFEHGKDELVEVIENDFSPIKCKRVKPLCRTRRVGWHDALEVFVEVYPAIVSTLHDIAYNEDSMSWNRDAMKDANGLLAAFEKTSISFCSCSGLQVLTHV